jgi:hypothetical protein
MKKLLTALAVAAALAAPVSQALAQATPAAAKPAAAKPAVKKAPVKKAVKKAPKKEAHPKAQDVSSGKKIPLDQDSDDENSEPEIAGTKTYEFNCELGNKVTIFRNDGDEKFIAIRWDKRIRRLIRVKTTTGANRFENHLAGLVWIGIPAKSMLLDSRKGQQLANECKLVESAAADAAAPAKS